MRLLVLALFIVFPIISQAQDSAALKVHFLYGSRPRHKYRKSEPRWFGGIHGGHVGVEGDKDKIVNFLMEGGYHWFGSRKNIHGKYLLSGYRPFYEILGGNADEAKKMIITIPVSGRQKEMFDSVSVVYLQDAPYDYACVGMRCAAASYDLLSQCGIVRQRGRNAMVLKIFIPIKLRKRLISMAHKQHWTIERQGGTHRRKWEKH